MKQLKIQTYYFDGKSIIEDQQNAFIKNQRLYVGEKKVEYTISNINYEIKMIGDAPTMILVNPMFKMIAIKEFEEFLYKRTDLYKACLELLETAKK